MTDEDHTTPIGGQADADAIPETGPETTPETTPEFGQPKAHTPLTLEALMAEISLVLNHICLVHDTELARIIGVGVDDDDFYYVGQVLPGRPSKSGIIQFSAVGPYESLKGKLERYDILDNLFTLNGMAPVAEMLILNEETDMSDLQRHETSSVKFFLDTGFEDDFENHEDDACQAINATSAAVDAIATGRIADARSMADLADLADEVAFYWNDEPDEFKFERSLRAFWRNENDAT